MLGVFVGVSSAHAATPSVVSTKITGSNTLTIVYSEPVITNSWDYTNFTGNLSGLGIMSITGSGTSIVTLTLNGIPSTSNTSGYLTIGTGVISASTNASFPGGTYNVTSAQAPILSSVSVSVNNIGDTFSAMGSQITLTFSTNKSVVNPTVTLLGHTIGVSGTGPGPYTVNYTLVSGDAQGTIPATILFTDTSGNSGSATVNILSNGTSNTTGSSGGYITSNANSSGVLYPGNTIVFTLVPSVTQSNVRSVAGSYNGVPLSWYTSNNGATYIATYTVALGQANTTYPLQISGVTLVDQYGNTVGPFSGTDVQKTIVASTASGPITIYQSAAIPTPNVNTTPSYSLVSTAPGIIRYGGDCSSQTTSASAGLNTIVMNTLANGLHSNCVITVTDSAGNISNQLVVSPFVVGTIVTTSPSSDLTAQIKALQDRLVSLQTQTSASGASKSYQFNNFLGIGSVSADVTALQNLLKEKGLYTGPITGRYGALTEAAVKKYQAAHGLTPAGYVGPGTREALNTGK